MQDSSNFKLSRSPSIHGGNLPLFFICLLPTFAEASTTWRERPRCPATNVRCHTGGCFSHRRHAGLASVDRRFGLGEQWTQKHDSQIGCKNKRSRCCN